MFKLVEAMSSENLILSILGIGGMIGGGFGIRKGYCLHKHDSYKICATQTTISCFCGVTIGVLLGGVVGLISPLVFPLVIPIICISVPVASGAVIAKYFDKDVSVIRK
jgi:hypothetical protein